MATFHKLMIYLLLCYIKLLLTAPLPRPEPAPLPPSVAQAAIATLTFIHAGVIGIALAHEADTDSLISKLTQRVRSHHGLSLFLVAIAT